MRLQKSFYWFLCRFLALFVLFSILLSASVNASSIDDIDEPIFYFKGDKVDAVNSGMSYFTDIDGYTIDCYYVNHQGVQTWFNGSLNAFTLSPVEMFVDITLPEEISRGEIIDFMLGLSFLDGFDEISGIEVLYFDSSWLSEYVGAPTFSTVSTIKYYNLKDITLNRSLNVLRFCMRWTPKSEDSVLDFEVKKLSISLVNEKGLINNVLSVIRNIFTSITNLPANIANSIKGFFDNVVNAVNNVFTAISELPVKIWNLIETGLKNLFVPSEDDIVSIQDDWDMLLRDRFGALYQAVDMVTDYADAFVEQEKSTITFPSVTIPLAGVNFVFGGWEVKVIPDGFGFLVDALKMVISIVCTFAVVNMLRNRFEKILTGGLNI